MVDPVTVTAIGSALGGAGQLIGGLTGGGKGYVQPGIWEQYNANLHHEQNLFRQKMALAQQHGLHPLTVLGVNASNFSPVISGPQGSGGGADYAAVGAGINNITRSFVKPPEEVKDPVTQRLEAANVRIAEANAKRAEWEALQSEFSTANMTSSHLLAGQPGNPPGVRTSNDATVTGALAAAQAGVPSSVLNSGGVNIKQDVTPPHPSILGHSLAADQSFQRLVDSSGKLYSTPNPNVFQPDIENYGTFHTLSNIYGVEKALMIMGALEQAPLAGGAALGIGALGTAAYRYFANQRKNAFAERERRMKDPNWRRWRGSSRSFRKSD